MSEWHLVFFKLLLQPLFKVGASSVSMFSFMLALIFIFGV